MSRRVQQAPLYDEASGFNGKGWVGDLLCVAERITESLEDVIWSFYIIPNILTVIILFSCGRDDLAVFKGRNRQLEITGGSDGYGPSHRTRSSEKALGREPRASLLTIWFLKQLVLQKKIIEKTYCMTWWCFFWWNFKLIWFPKDYETVEYFFTSKNPMVVLGARMIVWFMARSKMGAYAAWPRNKAGCHSRVLEEMNKSRLDGWTHSL